MNKKDKLRGCLLGQCLGDALGFPIEGHGPDDCNDFVFDQVAQWFKHEGSVSDDWPGQYTDDSQLARELLESMVSTNGFDPEDYAKRIGAIFGEGRIVGQGLATRNAALKLLAGIPWEEAGTPGPSAGNGTAMRAAPVGMYYFNDIPKMHEVAHLQGFITHKDPRCSAGSIAIAGAIALIMRDEVDDTRALLRQLSKWMRPYGDEFADLVLRLEEWIEIPPHQAVDVIAPAGKPKDYIDEWPGISPFVIPSVLWSLYAFLRYRDSYWDAISIALSVGGDVDTTAAMTGALSGAYLGEQALPLHLLERINDRGTWQYDDLTELCYQVLDPNGTR